jgi:hypothetical protein
MNIDVTVTVHHETASAWLVSDTGERDEAVWLPKSQARSEIEIDLSDGPVIADLSLPEWLAKEKGLI